MITGQSEIENRIARNICQEFGQAVSMNIGHAPRYHELFLGVPNDNHIHNTN